MSPCPGEEKVNRSRIKFSLLILAALAVVPATFGQGWPLAAKTPNTPVACPATSPACVDRVGKFTAPYGDPIKTFVGRYLDSQMTREYQAPFRTARARLVGLNTQRNRIYMIIGSALFAYDLTSFIDRLNAGATLTPASAFGAFNHSPVETFLLPDAWFYAEKAPSCIGGVPNTPPGCWTIDQTDGQDVFSILTGMTAATSMWLTTHMVGES